MDSQPGVLGAQSCASSRVFVSKVLMVRATRSLRQLATGRTEFRARGGN